MQPDNIHSQSPRRDSGSGSYPSWTSYCPSGNRSIEAGGMGAREKMPHPSLSHRSLLGPNLQNSKRAEPTWPWSTPYHICVVVTHVDPLASREPGLVLKHFLHEAQVARISVIEQAVSRGQSVPLLKRLPIPTHPQPQQSSPRPGPTFLHQPHPNLQYDRQRGESEEGSGPRGEKEGRPGKT